MHSNRKTYLFIFSLTLIVAVLLAALFFGLKDIHEKNEAIYNKRAILSAIADHLGGDLDDMSDDDVQNVFDLQIEQIVIDMEGNPIDQTLVVEAGYLGGQAEHVDMAKESKKLTSERMLPVFIYKNADDKKFYILSVRGKGLWDDIWGCIAMNEDLNTIAGVAFDHKGETPGLGAEIKDNGAWQAQFVDKKIFDDFGRFKGVTVRKGGAKDPIYEVDGISGATITADGVSEMLIRGLKYYEPYMNSL